MTAPLVAGIDFSSTAIHTALVPLEDDHADPACPPLTLRRAPLPDFTTYAWRKQGTTAQYRSVARARAIKHALRDLLGDVDGHDIVLVVVEEPFGDGGRNVMRELYGALLSHIPEHMHARALTANEWRDHLHLRPGYTKQVGIGYAAAYALAHHVPVTTDEHHAEATCLALAGRSQWHTDHTAAA